jgi:hypothetical protein
MNNLMGAYEWRSDTHPVQQVEHWMQIAKQYQEDLCNARRDIKALEEKLIRYMVNSKQQLAASQAREKALRDALEGFSEYPEYTPYKQAHEALSKPTDDSALRSYVAGYFRKASDAWEHEVKTWCLAVADQIEKGEV